MEGLKLFWSTTAHRGRKATGATATFPTVAHNEQLLILSSTRLASYNLSNAQGCAVQSAFRNKGTVQLRFRGPPDVSEGCI